MSKKHVVKQRMCIICRNRDVKENLLRIVRNPNGDFAFDETYKSPGRGAYICKKQDCVETAVKKKALNRVFKCNIANEIYERLLKIANN